MTAVSEPTSRRPVSGTGAAAVAATVAANAPAADHALADQGPAALRDFACLAVVTHLLPGDGRALRVVAGVTGVVDCDHAADAHLVVGAPSPRTARREVVERIARALPHAVVTVPHVVDYDAALLTYLERHHGEDPDELLASFDDCCAVAEALDRKV